MDDESVCPPLVAESDAQNNTTSTPNEVTNTQIDSTQVAGDKSEEELLKGLLTDNYCHVCEAELLFESQRLSHYEGKKHAQKLRVYLQAKKAEKKDKESTAHKWITTPDKDRFCELCNMVFSSHIVARSHYEGKIHVKNLRKQGLQPTEGYTLPSLTQDPDIADQKLPPEGCIEHPLDPTAITTASGTEVDLKDPNKYCAMCVASFNNPGMALQHYNGRKHLRNQARQELLKELGDDVQEANSLKCPVCSVQFTSVEMYSAHMQGNKHQIREKKVIDLCKSQQKVYSTFADELSDYVQVQRARGIAPKTSLALSLGDTQKEDEEYEEEEEEVLHKGEVIELNKHMPNMPPHYNAPHHSRLGCYNPVEVWRPPYMGPHWPPHGWDYNCPPPGLPGSGSPLFTSRPMKRRRQRKPSSSSASYSSSYSSSSSSSQNDSDDSEHRHREKRRIRRSRREKDQWKGDKDSDKEEKRRKQRRRERGKESDERRGWESGESEEEKRRKKRKIPSKRRRGENKSREEDLEADGGQRAMDNVMPEDMLDNRNETVADIQAELNVEQGYGGKDEPAKPKYRKEKKKIKEKIDNRTEEEKLWDDSILGC